MTHVDHNNAHIQSKAIHYYRIHFEPKTFKSCHVSRCLLYALIELSAFKEEILQRLNFVI